MVGISGYGMIQPVCAEILSLMAEGNSNRNTAKLLCLNTKTVKQHSSNLLKKLDLYNVSA